MHYWVSMVAHQIEKAYLLVGLELVPQLLTVLSTDLVIFQKRARHAN